jgi:hypothetical protein
MMQPPLPPAGGEEDGPRLDAEIASAESTLARLLEWIRAVDTKTPVVMAIATGMLGVVAALTPEPKELTAGIVTWMLIGVSPLLVTLALCALATFPQTTGPPGSLVYFGGIATRSLSEYVAAIRSRSKTAHLEDLLHQCHRNAEIAATKYRNVRRALFWLVAAIPAWLGTIYGLTRGS